jgi:hypothetical protein
MKLQTKIYAVAAIAVIWIVFAIASSMWMAHRINAAERAAETGKENGGRKGTACSRARKCRRRIQAKGGISGSESNRDRSNSEETK